MEEKVRLIRPEEVVLEKKKSLPDKVLAAFNQLIAEKWNGYSATIKQEDVVALMIKKGLKQKQILDKGWLDVEDVYREAGWIVEYDKPGYNESYLATFTFKKPK